MIFLKQIDWGKNEQISFLISEIMKLEQVKLTLILNNLIDEYCLENSIEFIGIHAKYLLKFLKKNMILNHIDLRRYLFIERSSLQLYYEYRKLNLDQKVLLTIYLLRFKQARISQIQAVNYFESCLNPMQELTPIRLVKRFPSYTFWSLP